MTHKLLILSRDAGEYRRLIEAAQLPGLEIVASSDVAAGLARGVGCDLAFGEPSLIARALPQLPGVRWVQSTWAGVEPLLDPALRHDYVLTNARGVFGPLMAEYVFGYLLAHERRIVPRHAAQQAGVWDRTPPGTLRNKRLGLLGVGSIGAVLARTGKHFGMHVQGYTRGSEDCADVDAYYHPPERAAFAADLDYLVSVLPNTATTRYIVDAALLAALPPRAVFVNVGRGSAVDEAALARALQTGRLAGAVLDVFQQEPLPPDHVFWRTPNLFITAHTAALSFPEDLARLFVENYRRFVAGEALRYRVDFEQGY
jgi:phosphoglycerate dehydrogenase-like enzyme